MHRNPDNVSTKQERIATLARQSPQMGFTSLAYLMDLEWLREAYRRTRKEMPAIDRFLKDYHGKGFEVVAISVDDPPEKIAAWMKDKGYLTFNPLKYTHPVYSLLLPLLFLMMGGIGLPGGAVYIEKWRLRSRTWETAVSLAGPFANALLALILGLILQFGPVTQSGIWPGLAFLGLVQISAVVLNLIPLPPFDGFGAIEPYLRLFCLTKKAPCPVRKRGCMCPTCKVHTRHQFTRDFYCDVGTEEEQARTVR